MNILVTGAAGYIGSHATLRLVRDGHRVVALDNLFRGHAETMERVASAAAGRLAFVAGDVGDRPLVEQLLRDHDIDAVMHFAALAYVGESVDEPLRYYRNNAAGALAILEACDAVGVRRFVFSSTCATYGEPPPDRIPIAESCPQNPINPYGRSKLHVENMLFDYARKQQSADEPFAFAALRYFNVAGCDRSGLIGEDHRPETHLIPRVLLTILGVYDELTIFGTDYPTPDGTCIRDYVHVEDLIDAHVSVMNALKPGDQRVYNLGIGRGYSVRQIIDSARRITRRELRVVEGPRRPGDPPTLYADPAKIQRELRWKAAITDLDDIVASAWRWFEQHPRGYAD